MLLESDPGQIPRLSVGDGRGPSRRPGQLFRPLPGAFIFEAKQNGVPLLLESASAMVLCVGPDDLTHLPESFGADAISASNFVGAGILSVAAGSVAEKAGVKAGDIVTEFAGTPIENARELRSYVDRVFPGAQAIVKIHRNGTDVVATARF